MKNKLIDLNNHLFAQMERLGEEDLGKDRERLAAEIDRSKAMSGLAREIIDNAKLNLEAQRLLGGREISSAPEMIGLEKQD